MFPTLAHLEAGFRELAGLVPLEVFVFFGALVEELVAPIPSMLVMTTTGLFARLEGHTPFFLIWLVVLGNIGKLIGSATYYKVGDKLEDIIVGRFGRYLGLDHHEIERFGARFTGNRWRDGALIFFLRVVPFFPSLMVSLAAGVVRIHFRTFLTASFVGNFCKDVFYIIAGYYGADVLRTFFLEIERVRFGLGMLLTLGVIASSLLLYIHRHRGLHLYRRLTAWFKQQ